MPHDGSGPAPAALPPGRWPTFDRAPAATFLDVDGTLLAGTTAYHFARQLRRRGLLGRSFLPRAVYHGLKHRCGRLDYGGLVASGLRDLAAIPVVALERIAYETFVEYIRPRLYEGAVEHVAALRRGGTPVVLVSSSLGLVLQPLAIYLGCADVLTTPVRIVRDRIVGLGEGPPCYGEGKRDWARRWADARQIAMDETAAYADNWSDRALLEAAGRAVVVHPRGRLRRLAHERGWTIVRPRRPRGEGRHGA